MYLRQTVWPGEEGQSVKFLTMERAVAQSISRLAQDALGNTNPYFVGLVCTPGTGLTVSIASGSLYQQQQIDPTAWPSAGTPTLAADTTVYTLQGLSEAAVVSPTIVPPGGGSGGQSFVALLEAQLQVTDAANVNTPFYNSANPASPNVIPKSPSRQNVIAYQWKYSAWGASPTVPTADSGWVPIASVLLAFGASSIVGGNITSPATASPVFYGFVQVNPNGNTPIFLNPASQQVGAASITGPFTSAPTTPGNVAAILGASNVFQANPVVDSNFAGQTLSLTWTLSGSMAFQSAGGLAGSNSLGATGVGSALNGTGVSVSLPVISGQTYYFAGDIIVPTYSGAGPKWEIIDPNSGNAVLGSGTGASNTSARLAGFSFVAPAGGVVQARANLNGVTCTGVVSFSRPCMLIPNSAVYLVNNPLTSTGSYLSQAQGDYLVLTGKITTAAFNSGTNPATETSLAIAGGIGYTGPHAGTSGDPYPVSQINAALFGGFPPSHYAAASGSYVTLYAGVPTLGTGNAGVSGYFQIGIATGTAPFLVASTTMVANLNANFVGGFAAGNASGNVPVSNGTLNTNLNAQFLNGLASSAFQAAGNYATMNATNTGTFSATGNISGTGGTGSSQIVAGYAATNSFGINGGNQVAYIQAPNYPLGLVGSSIRTNAPLYVGDSTRQNVYMQDVVASGVVRSGTPMFRITRVPGQTLASTAPGTGGSTDYGYLPSASGAINYFVGSAGQGTGIPQTLTYRMILTMANPLNVTFNFVVDERVAFFLDNITQGTFGANGAITQGSLSITIPSGTHTLDIAKTNDGQAEDQFVLHPWIPYPSGNMSPAVTSALPG